jgi:hypothetical protein
MDTTTQLSVRFNYPGDKYQTIHINMIRPECGMPKATTVNVRMFNKIVTIATLTGGGHYIT